MNIVIIGDLILDINNYGTITRLAPEANIPIYNVIETSYKLGGAANVCYNLENLNSNVELVSVIGTDIHSKTLLDELANKKIKHKLFLDEKRKTTQKTRIFKNNNISVRFDIEDTNDISPTIADNIIDYIFYRNKSVNAIIVSDYDKGVVSEYLCRKLISLANDRGIPTFIDPKTKDYEKYKNCFFLKPNLNEMKIMTVQCTTNDIENRLRFLKKSINCKHILLTMGENGMILLENGVKTIINGIKSNNVVDVTGSGDIVISMLVYFFIETGDLLYASKIANSVAAKGIEVLGNYVTTMDDIKEYRHYKIIHDYERDRIVSLSKTKQNIVFTNGCFDILHTAHLKLLQFAKKQGDILVVGLNSDNSIKRLKGENRPINNIEERSVMLSLFDFIDFVIIFNEDTPYTIIRDLKPNVLVKGGDYKIDEVVGNDLVDRVVLFDVIQNKSTTNIITKIKNIN
uniref:D-glycero-beta-D-manno-heptose 1-phosphate adenylyltransferase n=1 Tax=viral metagenome TaxID=1070528 RepID=A0A6C0LMA1_9ZZZZ